MEKQYYLISCEEREENNIGVIADRRDMKGKLREVLQRHFDDLAFDVHRIEPTGRVYDKKFIAHCTDWVGEEIKVQLEHTILYD